LYPSRASTADRPIGGNCNHRGHRDHREDRRGASTQL